MLILGTLDGDVGVGDAGCIELRACLRNIRFGCGTALKAVLCQLQCIGVGTNGIVQKSASNSEHKLPIASGAVPMLAFEAGLSHKRDTPEVLPDGPKSRQEPGRLRLNR
jgi:hypothetical protein